tara:strand:- start:1940 stop:3070 length:1131 start_codon:yes stop_codon:yes gene_type:complete
MLIRFQSGSVRLLQGRELTNSKLQLDALDGLRGLAVFLVFLSHTSLHGDNLIPYADFSGFGKSGVFLFFVLSAFLLTKPFLIRNAEEITLRFIVNYGFRRFLRIYPLYVIYLAVALVLTAVVPELFGNKSRAYPLPLDFSGYFRHLILQEGRGVTWSIPVEFSYYFLLPLIALTYSLLLKNRIVPCTIFTLLLIFVSQYFWPQAESLVNDIRVRSYLPIFFLGSFLAVLHHQTTSGEMVWSKESKTLIEASGIAAILLLFLMIPTVTSLFVEGGVSNNIFHKQFIIYGVLWSVVLYASICGRGWLQRFFELRLVRYFGFISFSFYLFHAPVLDLIYSQVDVPGVLYPWLVLLICVAFSHVSWILLEKPLSRMKLKS